MHIHTQKHARDYSSSSIESEILAISSSKLARAARAICEWNICGVMRTVAGGVAATDTLVKWTAMWVSSSLTAGASDASKSMTMFNFMPENVGRQSSLTVFFFPFLVTRAMALLRHVCDGAARLLKWAVVGFLVRVSCFFSAFPPFFANFFLFFFSFLLSWWLYGLRRECSGAPEREKYQKMERERVEEEEEAQSLWREEEARRRQHHLPFLVKFRVRKVPVRIRGSSTITKNAWRYNLQRKHITKIGEISLWESARERERETLSVAESWVKIFVFSDFANCKNGLFSSSYLYA